MSEKLSTKTKVIQVAVQPELKILIEKYVRYLSFKLSKRHTVSSFLSLSIMKLITQCYKKLINDESTNNNL